MKNRILLTTLILLAGVLLWTFLGEDRAGWSGAVLEQFAEQEGEHGTETGDLPEVPREDSQRSREPHSPEHAPADLSPGEDEELSGVRPDGSVLVEVSFDERFTSDGTSPHPLAGCVVRTQSWNEATYEVQVHEAAADTSGVARFEFPGDVHLDWFKADIPPRLGSLVAFEEVHTNISAGSLYRILLEPRLGGSLTGRVENLRGAPVAGVEVRAYQDGDGARDDELRMEEWYPGHFRAVSGPRGYFRFPAVPAANMYVAVSPASYLQIEPDLEGMFDESGYHDVEVGQTVDVGVLKVAARAVVDIHVIDRARNPAAQALVIIEPILFESPHLMTIEGWEAAFEGNGDEDEDQAERLLEERRRYLRWPTSVVELQADEQGHCTFIGVAGRWRVRARSLFESEEQSVDLVMKLPVAKFVVELPIDLADLSGLVVGHSTGEPISGARVKVYLLEGSDSRRTDEQGRFSFAGVNARVPYRLTVFHPDYFGESLEKRAAETRSTIRLHLASGINARIVDHNGQALASRDVRLGSRVGGPGQSASASQATEVARYAVQGARSSPSGNISFVKLLPGDYEVQLLLPVATGESGLFGEAIAVPSVWKTWTVPATKSGESLVADMRNYSPVKIHVYTDMRGDVRDSVTKQPISGAQIKVTWGGVTRVFLTDADGAYDFRVPVGEAVFDVSCQGYTDAHGSPVKYRRGSYRRRFRLAPIE